MLIAREKLKTIRPKMIVPCQRPTPIGFQKSCDFYLQQFIKHPGDSGFHSLTELYHAALLEADPAVSLFVPQPILLSYGRDQSYPPDCYFERDGKKFMVELKAEKGIAKFPLAFWQEYFAFHQIQFELIANEVVLAQEIKARNWLNIVRVLVAHQGIDSQAAEFELLDQLVLHDQLRLGEWLDPGDRQASCLRELALFRLAHRGKVLIDCEDKPLHWMTRINL